MRKLIALGTVLALVTILVVPTLLMLPGVAFAIPSGPGTGNTTIGGTLPQQTITVNAPTGMSFGTFTLGWNGPISGSGNVTTNMVTSFSLAAAASGTGYMSSGASSFANQLQIGPDGTAYVNANPGFNYSTSLDSNGNYHFNLYAKQLIVASDAALPTGSYSITITFTATITQ